MTLFFQHIIDAILNILFVYHTYGIIGAFFGFMIAVGGLGNIKKCISYTVAGYFFPITALVISYRYFEDV